MSSPEHEPAGARDTTEGHTYTITGGDWDEIFSAAQKADDERIIVNMGPQH
ncbi:NADH dehydrogenase subunit D, partial [Streptomyces sp. SID8361]